MIRAIQETPHTDELPTAVTSALYQQHGRVTWTPGAIRVSELYGFPVQHRIFPEAERLMREAREWLLGYVEPLGGGERLVHIVDETLSMSPYLFPDAEYEGALLATLIVSLQFVHDDIFDSVEVHGALPSTPAGLRLAEALRKLRANPRLLAQGILTSIELLRDPELSPATLPAAIPGSLFFWEAMRDFSRRMHSYARRAGSPHFPLWLESLCAMLKRHATSCANIYRNIDRLSIEEYAAHKLDNSGMHHTVQLLQLAQGTFLSPEQRQHPLLYTLEQHCAHIGSLLNEIMSYEKEVHRERSGNLLLAVMLQRGSSLVEATRYVAALAQQHANQVLRLAERARSEFSGASPQHQALQRYVDGLEQLAAGCWWWQVAGTDRYRSPASPFAEQLRQPSP